VQHGHLARRNMRDDVLRFAPMRHEEIARTRIPQHRHSPLGAEAVSVGLYGCPRLRGSGQPIERTPVGCKRIGINT